MSELALPLSLLVAGFASGLHCAGMCGGIAAGFSVLRKDQLWKRQLAFNLGRLTTYAAAGAAVGAVGAGAYLAAALPAQTALYVLASLVLVVAGVHLAGFGNSLRKLESLGMPLWRRVQPHAVRLVAIRPFAAGLAWLLAAGIATARLRGWLKLSAVRIAGGAMLIGTGAWSAAHASGLSDTVRQSLLCF